MDTLYMQMKAINDDLFELTKLLLNMSKQNPTDEAGELLRGMIPRISNRGYELNEIIKEREASWKRHHI